MSLLSFMARVAGDDADAYVRQALVTFGLNASPTTPRSTGVTACDENGDALAPRTTATPLAPLTHIGSDAWVLALDLTAYVGSEIQNVSDVPMLFTFATDQPAAGADVGLELVAGADRFFAPPRESGYRGKVWVRAVAGSNKTLRRNAW